MFRQLYHNSTYFLLITLVYSQISINYKFSIQFLLKFYLIHKILFIYVVIGRHDNSQFSPLDGFFISSHAIFNFLSLYLFCMFGNTLLTSLYGWSWLMRTEMTAFLMGLFLSLAIFLSRKPNFQKVNISCNWDFFIAMYYIYYDT